MEAKTGWTEGKPWEVSLGRARLRRSEMEATTIDAWFALPLQRSKLNDNPSIGYASA